MRQKIAGKTLLALPPHEISPNPHNPRLVFDAQDLLELKDSIAKVGILVPITVYENKRRSPKTKYVLLDGERRWRCAIDLKLAEIPANVIDEPRDVTQNILFMFNIHHYRKEWELFPTALKLDVLIKELDTDSESTLSNFTGVNRTTIRRCKALLWFPDKYRTILMARDSTISTDFFIEVYPIAYRLSQEAEYIYPDKIQLFIDTCMKKFADDLITDVKEFRELRKCMGFYDQTQSFEQFKSKIGQFASVESLGLEIFAVPEIEDDRKRRNVLKYLSYLNQNLKAINPDLISDIYFIDQLTALQKTLNSLLEKID